MRTDGTHAPQGDKVLLNNILAKASLYRALSQSQLDEIAISSRVIRSFGSSWIVTQGEAPKGVYVVIYGQVKLYFERQDGTEKTMAILGNDNCFGIGEAIIDQPHLALAKTISDAMIVYTPKEKLFEAAEQNFSFALDLMACAARQVHCLMRDVERNAFESATQRLAGYLLRQSDYQSTETVELNASKTLIASRLSIAGETFSRLLHGFSTKGLIEVKGRRVRILDRQKMGALLPAENS